MLHLVGGQPTALNIMGTLDATVAPADQDISTSKENIKFESYVCSAQELEILGGAVKVKSPEYFSFNARYADKTEERRIQSEFHKDGKVKKSIFNKPPHTNIFRSL